MDQLLAGYAAEGIVFVRTVEITDIPHGVHVADVIAAPRIKFPVLSDCSIVSCGFHRPCLLITPSEWRGRHQTNHPYRTRQAGQRHCRSMLEAQSKKVACLFGCLRLHPISSGHIRQI
jgi:hypothetical protein